MSDVVSQREREEMATPETPGVAANHVSMHIVVSLKRISISVLALRRQPRLSPREALGAQSAAVTRACFRLSVLCVVCAVLGVLADAESRISSFNPKRGDET